MTLAPTATDRGTETRRRILEVAAQAFADRGYAGTSLNDVLKASGVTKGGFYFHFPSKEALALATLRHKQDQWAGVVMAAVPPVTALSSEVLSVTVTELLTR